VNHTRFPKQNHLPDCASRDNQVKKGDRVEYCLNNELSFKKGKTELFMQYRFIITNLKNRIPLAAENM